MLNQYIARAVVRYLDGDTEYFQELVNKAIGIHKGMYGEPGPLYVPIQDILRAKGGAA